MPNTPALRSIPSFVRSQTTFSFCVFWYILSAHVHHIHHWLLRVPATRCGMAQAYHKLALSDWWPVADLPPASARSRVIKWSWVLLGPTPDAAGSY